MAHVVNIRMLGWLVVGLSCLFVLLYFSFSNTGEVTRHQSVTGESAAVERAVRSRTGDRMVYEAVLPVKEDATLPDFDHDDIAEVGGISAHESVSIDEFLDPEMFDTAITPIQKNVGVSLDVDGEPEYQAVEDSSPRNVGIFIEADDADSGFVSSDESEAANVGEYLDPDGLE